MRSLVGVILLVVAAVALAAIVSSMHGPSTASPLPNEVPDTPPTQTNTNAKPAASAPAPTDSNRAAAFDKVKDGAIRVTMEVANRGAIVMELYPKAAPQTVAHFVELAKQHFYDGTKFHRYVAGFVVQGGDPKSKTVDGAQMADITPEEVGQKFGLGSGGSGKTVPLEVKLPHIRGSVGLARSQAPDSGDSQFFFNLADNSSLDSGYCAFGRVVQGEDVMDKLRQGDTITKMTVQ